MSECIFIDSLGTITKEEVVATVDYNILPNTFVLETQEPFPGYLHDDPKEKNPKSLFFITKKIYGREEVSRAQQKIEQYFQHDFNASSAQIEIFINTYNAVRIKDMNNYEDIKELQKCFQNEGFKFVKRKDIENKGIITVKKFFRLEESVDENFCLDREDPHMSYIIIPKQLSWKLFEKIALSIKTNWDFKDFDAALGTIYLHGEVKDVVRIYADKLTHEKVKMIKERYMKELIKY